MQIHFFDDDVERLIGRLEAATIAKVLRTIDLLERFGYALQMPHSKKVKSNLHELRVRGGQEVRIFYTFFNNNIVLLHGYVKKTERTPKRELKVATLKMRSLS